MIEAVPDESVITAAPKGLYALVVLLQTGLDKKVMFSFGIALLTVTVIQPGPDFCKERTGVRGGAG